MNDLKISTETNEKINQLMSFVADGVKTAGEFTMEQAPLVAKEIVAYGFWSAVAMLISIVSTFSLLAIFSYRKINNHVKDTKEKHGEYYSVSDLNDGIIVPYAMAIILSIIAILITIPINTNTILKTSVAPRLYVIDTLRGK